MKRITTDLHVATEQDAAVLDERQEAYLEWLLTPEFGRTPSTKAAYAQHAGVHAVTLNRWEKLAHFRSAYQRRVQQGIATPERVQLITDQLFEQATDPNNRNQLKAMELWAKMAGLLKQEAPPATTPQEEMAALSDEELDALVAQQARAEQSARKRA